MPHWVDPGLCSKTINIVSSSYLTGMLFHVRIPRINSGESTFDCREFGFKRQSESREVITVQNAQVTRREYDAEIDW